MLVEAWLLAFFQFFFFLLDELTIFIVLRHLLQEDILSTLVRFRESIKDIATVTAIILTELYLELLPKQRIRNTNI